MEQRVKQSYIPMTNVTNITTKHTLGKLSVALSDTPDETCGIARRIGYTGKCETDLAIYRLKVKSGPKYAVVTLPQLFVVTEGRFVEYDLWCVDQKTLQTTPQ